MSFSRTDAFTTIDKKSGKFQKLEAYRISRHSDDSTVSSSSEEDDLKDLIETLDNFEISKASRNRELNRRISGSSRWGPEEICEYTSDENSFYETANSASLSNNSSLNNCSPSTIKSSSSDSVLLKSEGIVDFSDETNSVASVNENSSESRNLPSMQRSFNTCLDHALNQQSSSAQESSFCKCKEAAPEDVPSLRDRCFVVGIPETTIDDGITRIIPVKLSANENSHSSPKQLFHQMSSSDKSSCSSEEWAKLITSDKVLSLNVSNKILWENESTSSLSSIDTSSNGDEVLQTRPDSHVSGARISKSLDLELKSSSFELKSTSSEERSEKDGRAFRLPLHQESKKFAENRSNFSTKTEREELSSSLSFNSEQEEERLVRKSDYEKILECLNLKSSDESDDSRESSLRRSESLASAVQRSVACSFASQNLHDFSKGNCSLMETFNSSNLHTSTNTSQVKCRALKGRSQKKGFDANSSHTEEKLSNLETASSLNVSENTTMTKGNVRIWKGKKQKRLLESNDSNKIYHAFDDALIHEDHFSDEEDSLDESALLDLHDQKCIQRSDCDFNFVDFDSKELDSVLCDGLEDNRKHAPSLPSLPSDTCEAEKQKKFKHHDKRPNLFDTIDKILRLGTDDVALNRLKTASESGGPLQSIDGTVIDSELQPFAVDFTKPRPADEDIFYWVPCDFKDYLQVSDRPLVSDYFPKNATGIQFCCVMVREFVHVHFYLRLHERCQPAYAKYNIVIWDKSRQPVAHFRSHAPIYFQAGQAHHVSTFSNQSMTELLGQEMLVVSCHVTSFAKWEKTGHENTPWYFSNGTAGRLKSKDDMMSLYCSQEYADVTLESSDGQKFPAHRAVICKESQLLKQSVDLCSTRFIRLNISGRLLKQMLYVFYTGELPPQEAIERISVPLPRWQEICELLVAAERYEAARLGRKCQAWLGISLSQENVCTVYALAVRLGLPALTHACRSFIKKHRESVVNSAEWLTLKDSPAAVADLLLNTDIYDRHGGTEHLELDREEDLHCLNEFNIAPNNFDKKVTFKDILYEFGYSPNP